jgi:hypothetical protein
MALSARMLALIQKIDAADAEHFSALREMAKKQAEARSKSSEQKLANLRLARARLARRLARNKKRRTPVQSSDDTGR